MRVARGIAAAFMLASTAACTPDGSDPAPVRSQSDYATYLQEYLAKGTCKVDVTIWTEKDRTAANTYVEGNGNPTDACPNPDVRVVVDDDPSLKTGQNVGGRVSIRYSYNGSSNTGTDA